jgi:L-aminopeptidase/D-esterase-like protein/predicted double-glycine peptidase
MIKIRILKTKGITMKRFFAYRPGASLLIIAGVLLITVFSSLSCRTDSPAVQVAAADVKKDSATPGVRARELGVPFDGVPGKFNAITDVAGVEVGHATIISGEGTLVRGKGPVRTGVTAILPRGKTYDPVFGACYALNGNGEMTGAWWLEESGFIESPICITNTNSVGTVRDALALWQIERKLGDEEDASLSVVAETYDGYLNDLNGFHVKKEHVYAALDGAKSGPVAEGSVGGGTGMICHQFKAGVGTSSRVLDKKDGGYTVGVIIQANHGRRSTLLIGGVPVGKEMTEDMPLINSVLSGGGSGKESSIIVVVATDAPLMPHQLKRLVRRVPLGLARVGTVALNGSGEIFIAFSTANPGAYGQKEVKIDTIDNDCMNRIFEAVVQATEESVVNAIVAGRTMVGINGNTAYGISHERLVEVLRKYNRLNTNFIRVPTCRQGFDYTCGVASLQSIMRYYGEEIREDNLSKELGTTPEDGTECERIAQLAKDKGYQVDMKTGADIGDLKRSIDKGIPAIVAIQAWNDDPKTDYSNDWEDGHYAVAIGYDRKNIYFMDPSTLGNYTYIPCDEFVKRWHDEDKGKKYPQTMISISKSAPPAYKPTAIPKLD